MNIKENDIISQKILTKKLVDFRFALRFYRIFLFSDPLFKKLNYEQ